MEKGIQKSCNQSKKEKKEVNSWDCSTPSTNGELSTGKPNEWDSGSECRETMVEPFHNDESSKSHNYWDSESENSASNKAFEESKAFSISNADSDDFSPRCLSAAKSLKTKTSKTEDELLLVEDFEDFMEESKTEKITKLEELSPSSTDLHTENEKVRSNQSEGTPEDTTIWMIPKSERTQSRGSTSKLISSSIREVEIQKHKHFFKKSKSQSDVQKFKLQRKRLRSSRSVCISPEKNCYSTPWEWETLHAKRKLEIELEKHKSNISGRENFDRNSVFFTEFECRAMTVDMNTPEKLQPSPGGLEEVNAASNEIIPESQEERNADEYCNTEDDMGLAGPSGAVWTDVLSLPDMTGKKSMKKRQTDMSNVPKKKCQAPENKPESTGQISESWLLLDDKGQYQTISRNVVSLLLNGRSTEAVLQGRKEHLIPNINLKDSNSLRDSLSSVLTKDSGEFLKMCDMGGEDEGKKVVDLERKVENTLIYIQPGMNQTTSVRIIPMDREMIHVWRRTIDGGSAVSLESDVTNPSQDSVELMNHQNSPLESNSSHLSNFHRPFTETTVSEEDENPPEDSVKRHRLPVDSGLHESEVTKYTKLLFETRVIVDNLTNNFKTLQNRLEGETNRNVALQGEVQKLRLLMKNCAETIGEAEIQSISPNPTSTPLIADKNHNAVQEEIVAEERLNYIDDNCSKITLEIEDKSATVDIQEIEEPNVNEEPEVITVNIYTMESFETVGDNQGTQGNQGPYSMVQSNLKIIEDRMKSLQRENEVLLKQNVELKRKLKEISVELEKYLAGTSELDSCLEDSKEQDASRDQVCNLKLEPENLKIVLKEQIPEENSEVREEREKLICIENWYKMANEIFEKIEFTKKYLLENEIELSINMVKADATQDSNTFSNFLTFYIEEITRILLKIKNENFLFEQTLMDLQKQSNTAKEISGLDDVISGCAELIEQCKKGQINSETESKVMEDYFTVIMEKASLMQEVKILKTENEILVQGQVEHYEKLKETMIALKDRKNEVTTLESAHKLLEEERCTMEKVLKLCEDEKKALEVGILEKNKKICDLMDEIKRKDSEIANCNDRLSALQDEMASFKKSSFLKDELLNKLKLQYEELLTAEGKKDNKIEILQEDIRNLELRGAQLEAELTSSKLFVNESQKEMRDYIAHLEALVNTSQDSIEKLKQKLKETNQTINRLKNESDILEKQHQCDVKLFNSTKDELDSCKEKLTKNENKLKESEEKWGKLQKKYEELVGSGKERSETLEFVSKKLNSVLNENEKLTEKVEMFSKDKDELLKEQKQLINQYAVLSKDIHKLQDKYRNVKSECNERTNLIKYLEMMLKENLVEYNSRIACLEQNISQIIEKIVVWKNGIKEKYILDAEIQELRQQLDVTWQERKEMEKAVSSYYSLTKLLEQQVEEREKKVDELHAKLSLEQHDNKQQKSEEILEPSDNSEFLKIQQLERQVQKTEEELAECRKEFQKCQDDFENDKKKLELTIAEQKSEIKRYQLRIEVMMRNFSHCNRSMNGLTQDKRNVEDSEFQILKKNFREKEKEILELKDVINKYKAEIEVKDSDLEKSKKMNFLQDEELKKLQNQIVQMKDAMSAANKSNKTQQKERDEMAEKLFQSIKLIMEERSARQALETLVVEKEKNFKNQIEEMKNELTSKTKELETVIETLEEKRKLVCKLQDEVRKFKAEISSSKGQTNDNRKRNNHKGNGDATVWTEQCLLTSTPIKSQNISVERLESCLKELKEAREINLQLRQTEGQYQAKIVRLEDEIRDARLLIKELQGDIKTEKKSKKAFKNMIIAAKAEIEKCVLAKQLMSVIAERISRHLDLSEIPSREFLSGFRLSDTSSSSKCVD